MEATVRDSSTPGVDPTLRDQVLDVLARLALTADTGEVEEYLALIAEDAVWEFPDNPILGTPAQRLTGKAEIEEGVRSRRARGVQGPGSYTQHVVTSVVVEQLGEDSARARAAWMFLADTIGTPRISGVGHYDDLLRLVDGRWMMAHRQVSFG